MKSNLLSRIQSALGLARQGIVFISLFVFLGVIFWSNFITLKVVENYSLADFKNRQVVRVANQIRPQLMKARWACAMLFSTKDSATWSNQCYQPLEASLAQISEELKIKNYEELGQSLDDLYKMVEQSERTNRPEERKKISDQFIGKTEEIFVRLGEIESEMWAEGSSRYSQLVGDFSLANKLAFVSVILVIGIIIYFFGILSLKERADKKLAIANANIEAQKIALINSSKMSSLGEMAAGLAHEINNPLAIMQFNSKKIVKLCKNDGPLNKSQLIIASENILAMTSRVAKIINGLRTFAREGEGDPFVECNMADVVNETIALCSTRLTNHSIELRILPIPESCKAEMRATQISQVLLNLIGNAHDAIEKQEGDKWIEVGVEDLGGRVRLSVADSGKGIPETTKEKLFTPFFTTKEVGKGTGLGLSIAMGIIKTHNGVLALDEQSTHTKFYFEIPKIHESTIPQVA